MVAIFTGMGVGAERGSGNVLGAAGLLGGSSLGRSAEQILLNAATGNLMIQQRDEMLVGLGPDASIARTYNSRGDLSDDNADNWRQSTDRRIYGLTGTINTAGSTIKRVSADGSEITYTYQTITRTIVTPSGPVTQSDSAYFATDGAGAYDKLSWNSGTSIWTWTDEDTQLTETYGYASGSQYLITKQTDTSGDSVTFSYVSGTSHLDKVTTADGSGSQYLQYAWSGNNITQITTSYKDLVANTAKTLTRTRYTYDSANRLSTVSVDLSPEDNSIADGKVYTTTYTYKAASGADMHLVSSIAETDGSLLTIGYDGSQRVTSLVQTVASGVTRTTTINYVSTTRTTITDQTGQVTTLDYDANDNLTTITAPPASAGLASQVTQFAYNSNGDVTSITDPLGNMTSYSDFTPYGDAQTITDPLGNVTKRAFGFKNELLTETVKGADQATDNVTVNDHTTRYVYDGNNRVVFAINPDGNVVEHRYDTNGREWLTLTYVGQPYDVSGLLFDQVPTQIQMNSWVSSGLIDPTAVDQTFISYDARGNILAVVGYATSTSPGNASVANGYSNTAYVYDQAGQLLSRKDYMRTAETFIYDGLGRAVASVDIQGGTTSVLFDDANARTIITLANGLSQTSTYNKAGELIAYAQSAAPTGGTNLKPDLANAGQWTLTRLTPSASTIDGVAATQFQISSTNGNLTTGPFLVHAGDTLTWEVTLMGVTGSLSDMFGFNGNGSAGVSPSGWGDGSQATATILSGPGSITVQNAGGPSQISGLSTTTGTRVRITRTFTSTENVYGFFYVKAPNQGTTTDGVVMAAPSIIKTTAADPQVTAATSTYGYDQLGRLRVATDATGNKSYYEYDAIGRKIADIDQAGNVVEYKYDADNRLIATVRYAAALNSTQLSSLQSAPTTFDFASNRPADTAGTLWTFNVYDKDGHTIETIDGAGEATAYSYDASGKLTGTTAYANKLTATQLALLKTQLTNRANGALSRINNSQFDGITGWMTGTDPSNIVKIGSPYAGTSGGHSYLKTEFTATTGGQVTSISTDASNWFAVNPGERLAASVGVEGQGPVSSLIFDFNWLDANGHSLPTTTIGQAIGPAAFNTKIAGFATVPVGAVSARFEVYMVSSAAGTGSFSMIEPMVSSVNPSQVDQPPFLPTPVFDAAHDAVSRIFYDKSGRVIGTLDGEGYFSTITYDAGGFKVAETRYAKQVAANIRATAKFTDLTAGTSAADRTTHYVYDNEGLLTFVVDAQNHVTEYFYSLSAYVIGKATKTTQYASTIGAPTSWTVADVRAAINAVAGLASNTNNRISQSIYDEHENLISAVDAAGSFTAFSYDAMGHVTKTVRYAAAWDGSTMSAHAADAGNRVTRFYYDARGDLTFTIDGEGYVTRYDYDGEDRQVATVTWDNPVSLGSVNESTSVLDIPALLSGNYTATSTSYDMDGRVSTATDGEGVITSYVYNANGTLKTKTEAYGTSDAVQTYYVYDAAGRAISRYDANGSPDVALTQFEYDAFGNVSASTDPNGVRHTYNYDRVGNLTSKTDQENQTTGYQYNAFGEVTVTTDPLLNKSYIYYDILGRVTATRDADNRVTETDYSKFGEVKVTRRANPTAQTDKTVAPTYGASGDSLADAARDAVTIYTYDKAGRLQTTTDAEGGFTTITYNTFGEAWIETDLLGASTTVQTTNSYDRRGLLQTQVVDSASGGKAITTGYGYDAFGRQTSLTNAVHKGSSATYDRDGRLKSKTDPLGNTTSYSYDKRGNLVATTDAAGKITRFVYDSQDRKIAMIDALGAVTVDSYDADGNLVLTQAYTTTVGLAGQPLQVTSALYASLAGAPARATHFVYDKDGRLRFTIDALGQVTEQVHDADDNVVRIVQYNGTVTPGAYTIEAISALVSGRSGRVTRAVYDAANQLIYSIDAIGQVTHNSYDALERVVRATEFYKPYTDLATPPLQTMDSWATNSSNIDALHDRTTRSWYDRNGQLRYSMDAANYVTRYDYDRAGNVIRQTVFADANSTADTTLDNPAVTTIATLDAAYPNTTGTAKITTFGYDTAGRLVTTTNWIDGAGGANTVAITRALELDAMGRVLSSTEASNTGDASKTSYLYDDAGRVVRKISADTTADASTEYYYYDALGRRVATVDGDGYLCVWGYDDADNLTSETRYGTGIAAALGMSVAALQALAGTAADDATTTIYYDAFGDAIRTVDPRGNETLAFYDSLGRVTRQVDAERYVTDTTYTRGGQVATVSRRQTGTNAWPADGTTWTATGATNMATGSTIDGSNSYTLKPQTGGVAGYVESAGTAAAAGQTVTFSFWIKKGSITTASFGINAVGGGWGANGDTTASIVSGSGTLAQTSGGLWSISGLGDQPTLVVVTRTLTANDTVKARLYAGNSSSPINSADTVIVADPLFTGADAVTSFTYDNDDRLTSTTDAEGYTESYTLDAFGERIQVRNKLNGTVVDGVTLDTTALYEFDKRGLLTKETLPVATQSTANIVNTYNYDARGNRTQMVEASGATEQRTTNYSYDKLDRLTRTEHDQVDTVTLTDSGLVNATGVTPVETLTYDARGNVIERDQASRVGSTTTVYARTLYWYDDLGRATTMLAQSDATSGVVTTYGYDKNGNRSRETTYATPGTLPATAGGTAPTPTGNYRQTTYTYDRANRLKSTKVSSLVIWAGAGSAVTTADVVTSLSYDRDGNVTVQTDGRLNGIYSWYDRLGHAIAQVDAEGYLTVWTRDAEGNALSETRYANPVTIAVGGSTQLSDVVSHIGTGATDADRTTVFTYDRNGRRRTETRLNVASRTVATNGTLSAADTVSDATITYSYNGLGEVLSKAEANADTTRYKYDKIGRLILETDQGFTDVNNQLVTPRTAYSYDGLNNLLTTRVQVDATGTSVNDRVTTYGYGAGGRLASVTDAAHNVHYYGYDVAGRQVLDRYTRKLSNGANVDSEAQVSRYDVAGRVITQTTARYTGSTWVFANAAGTAYDAVRMRYDAFGEMTGRGITAGPAATAVYQEAFDYDAGGRLWHSNTGDGVDRFYLYDKAGNQTLALASAGADMSGYAAGIYNYTSLISSSGTIVAANSVTNLNATTTVTIYDKRGQAQFVRSPDRQLTSGTTVTTITTGKTYNAFGEVHSETEARGFDASGNAVAGFTTTYGYNTLGKLTAKILPLVSVTRANGVTAAVNPTEHYFYDISGRLVAVEDADSADSGTHYYTTRLLLAGTGHGDDDALVTQQFDPEGGSTKTGYDVFGDARLSSVLVSADGGVNVWRTTLSDYDQMGRLITVTHPTVAGGQVGNNDPNLTTHYDQQLVDHYTYDLLGERITHSQNWSESGMSKSRIETTDYDYKGRVVSTVGYAGDAMSYAYSAFDTSKVTTGLGTFGGSTKTVTNVAAGYSQWEVDDYFGRTVDSQDYDKTTYDGIAPHDYDYTFDKAGRLVGRSNSAGESLSFAYLNSGLAAGQGGTQGTAAYSYDLAGNRVAETLIKGGVQYRDATAQFDALGRMTQWDDVATAVGGTGSISSNPIETKWEYDASGNVRVAKTSYRPINANGGFDAIVSPARQEWYFYDKTGRVTLSQGVFTGTAGSGSIGRGDDSGISISYYLDGNRRSTLSTQTLAWTGWVTAKAPYTYYDEDPQDGTPLRGAHDTYRGDQQESYTYAADGSLAKVVTTSQGYILSGAGVSANFDHSMTGQGSMVTIDRDALGRIVHYLESSSKGTYERKGVTYDAADREAGETAITIHGAVIDTSVISDTYVNGLLDHQTQHNYTATVNASNPIDGTADGAAADTRQDYTYKWWDGALQSSISYDSDTGNGGNALWVTNYLYDASGHITQAQITDGQPRNATYVTDQNGMIIDRHEARQNGTTTAMPREVHYLYGGIQLGQVGNNGTDNVTYAASIATRLTPPTQHGLFANGATKATPFADFDQNYDAINGSSVAGTASSYTVQGGDTLSSIAQTVWGDANLWYLIADANGKSAGVALTAGEVLTIPAKVVSRANTSDTFRPYDPNEAMGDTSPTRAPAPPKANNCGELGMILLVVIAVAVTIATHGAAAGLAASILGTSSSSFGAVVLGGAISGVLGSVASQVVGVATGIQQGGFNWKGVALAGIAGAIGGGLEGIGNIGVSGAEVASSAAGSAAADVAGQIVRAASGIGAAFGSAARAVAASALTQGVGSLLHLQSKFDWVGVAAAGVGAFASSGVGSAIHGNTGAVVGGVAGGIANASVRSLITGTDFGDNLRAALPDIIGNTVGSLVGDHIVKIFGSSSDAEQVRQMPVDNGAVSGQPTSALGLDRPPAARSILNLDRYLMNSASDSDSGSAVAPSHGNVAAIFETRNTHAEWADDGSGDIIVTGIRPHPAPTLFWPGMGLVEDTHAGPRLHGDYITASPRIPFLPYYPGQYYLGSSQPRQQADVFAAERALLMAYRPPRIVVAGSLLPGTSPLSVGSAAPTTFDVAPPEPGLKDRALNYLSSSWADFVGNVASGPSSGRAEIYRATGGDPMEASRMRLADRDTLIGGGTGLMVKGTQQYGLGMALSPASVVYNGVTGTYQIVTTDPRTTISGVWNGLTTPSQYFSGTREAFNNGDLLRLGLANGETALNIATLPDAGAGVWGLGERFLGRGVAAESKVLSPFTERYLTESGGRWGGTATRQQNYAISQELEARGYSFPERPGGGLGPEEYIAGSGSRGGTYVDITGIAPNGRTVRIQTVTTLADGVTPTASEAAAAARIRAAFPNDKLLLVPKR